MSVVAINFKLRLEFDLAGPPSLQPLEGVFFLDFDLYRMNEVFAVRAATALLPGWLLL